MSGQDPSKSFHRKAMETRDLHIAAQEKQQHRVAEMGLVSSFGEDTKGLEEDTEHRSVPKQAAKEKHVPAPEMNNEDLEARKRLNTHTVGQGEEVESQERLRTQLPQHAALLSSSSPIIVDSTQPKDVVLVHNSNKDYFQNPGNKRLRELVRGATEEFQNAEKQGAKMDIALRLLATIKESGGRFLLAREDQRWEVLSDAEAEKRIRKRFWNVQRPKKGMVRLEPSVSSSPSSSKSAPVLVDSTQPKDVLFGHRLSKEDINNPGNKQLRELVRGAMEEYKNAQRGMKMDIALRLLATVQENGGRCLLAREGQKWEVLSDKEARKRVSNKFWNLQRCKQDRVSIKPPRPSSSSAPVPADSILPNDVLFGNHLTKEYMNNPGNKRLRALVRGATEEYKVAEQHGKGMDVILRLLATVHENGGRCLSAREDQNWEILSDDEAKKRIIKRFANLKRSRAHPSSLSPRCRTNSSDADGTIGMIPPKKWKTLIENQEKIKNVSIQTIRKLWLKQRMDRPKGGGFINWKNDAIEEGRTMLLCALYHKRWDIAKLLLLEHDGADVTIADKYDCTALMYAALYGNFEMVQLLVEKGADITSVNEFGWTVCMHAAVGGDMEIVEFLLEKGADSTIACPKGETALSVAKTLGHTELVHLLSNKKSRCSAV